MAEEFADVKEVTGAAAEIDNAHRRGAVEPKVLRTLDVDLDPINDVLETIDPRRAWPIRVCSRNFSNCARSRVSRMGRRLTGCVRRLRCSNALANRSGESNF